MEKAKPVRKDVIIYGFGIAGRWAIEKFDSVISFVDTDKKKWGKTHKGVKVHSPDYLKTLDLTKTLVVVAAVDIFDVVPNLQRLNVSSWASLTEFIEENDAVTNCTGESDSFLAYSIETVKNCHAAYFNESKLVLRSVDLVITEKCTLKCKDCANLMQFFDSPRNFDSKDILLGINLLTDKCDAINEVRVIGGEPFLNKSIYSILDALINIENIHAIVIYTNGMIPPKAEHAQLLQNNKIQFSVTDYGDLAKNTSKTVEFLERENISYRVHPPENWTDSGRIEKFNRDNEELKDIFSKCCGKNLYTMVEDRLYRCPFAANADSLRAVPGNPENYVKATESAEEIRKYAYDIEFIPACNYCPGRSFDSPEIVPAIQVDSRKPIPYKKF
ncbi:radical SAM protein [Alphaproteobacteria bacterium]|nr:radical SAM protein [Alphaproteobacteria bacterium]MDC1120288.1 radical SAM protein [Alphaproteobacteria bacterium]